MTTYRNGDIVSFSKSQVSVLTVLTTLVEAYSVTLPVGGTPKTFTFTSTPGLTLSQIADGLRLVLRQEQTPYLVEVGSPAWSLLVAGPEGESFDPVVTPNLQVVLGSAAVRGRKPRHVQVIRTREITTRTGTHELILGRELESGEVFEFYSDEAQILISRGAGP